MAKLSPETRATIVGLKEKLLDVIDEAKSLEFTLLERFGETEETIVAMDELAEISEQARDRFSQLSRVQLQVAESQPTVSDDMLRLVMQAIAFIENRIPALERSVQEIKIDWRLQ